MNSLPFDEMSLDESNCSTSKTYVMQSDMVIEKKILICYNVINWKRMAPELAKKLAVNNFDVY